MMSKILEINNVILVSIVFLYLTNTAENRPNGNTIKNHHANSSNKNELPSIVRLSLKHSNEDGFSSQGYSSRQALFPKDTSFGHYGKHNSKRWLKRRIRRLERKYLKNYSRKPRGNNNERRRKSFEEEKMIRIKLGVKRPKPMQTREFESLVKHLGFDYEHIVTLRGQQLTELQANEEDNIPYPTNEPGSFRIAFNATELSHRQQAVADHAKFITYIAQDTSGDSDADHQDSMDKENFPCHCDLKICEVVRLSHNETTGGKSCIIVPRMSIKLDSWNTFDVSDIIKSSSIFHDDRNNEDPAIASFRSSSNKIIKITMSSNNRNFKVNAYNNNNVGGNDPGYDKGLKVPILYLSIQQVDCSFLNKDTNFTVSTRIEEVHYHDTDYTHQCYLNLRSGTHSSRTHDDRSPLLVLLSSRQNHNNAKALSSAEDLLFRNLETNGEFQNIESNGKDNTNRTLPLLAQPKSRSKRRARRHICRRKEMYVDFADMKWADTILYPRGFQAYQCVGRCYSPIRQHLTPTTHAVIQNLMHAKHPRRAGRACCVPTKLKGMSIMFIDKHGNTDKRDFDGMIVEECGCR